MKKIFFVILLAIAGQNVMSQDTISRIYPDSSYFYNIWVSLDSVNDFSWKCVAHGHQDYTGVEFVTKDSITIYGIAVCASFDTIGWDNGLPSDRYYAYDKSYDSCFEDFMIYKRTSPVPTMVSESKRIHINETPISYYWDFGIIRNQLAVFPTYELYFENSITLADTFYVGGTGYCSNSYFDTIENMLYQKLRWPLRMYFLDCPSVYVNFMGHDIETGWVYHGVPMHLFLPLIFPIITPLENLNSDSTIVNDSTGVGGDTLVIETRSLLDRFVVAKPNPASSAVQVVSSVGLSSVAVFDINGREVNKTMASGLACTIDVGEWERGIYVFSINTPMGEVRKKVIVQ